jgi:hypothetical protein
MVVQAVEEVQVIQPLDRLVEQEIHQIQARLKGIMVVLAILMAQLTLTIVQAAVAVVLTLLVTMDQI